MKNKIGDLRDHLFLALERLGNNELTSDEMKSEIERSKAISNLGNVIVESAKAQIMFARFTGEGADDPRKFLEESIKKTERPIAVYTNIKSPLGIANEG